MAELVVMPRQGNTVESCVIVEWVKNEGESVSVGDVLCTVETDKSTLDIESEHEGTLLRILQNEDDEVPVLDPIAIIGREGEDISSLLSEAEGEESGAEESGSKETGVGQPRAEESEFRAAETSDKGDNQADEKNKKNKAESESKTHGISPRARNLAAVKGVSTEQLRGSGPQGRVIERDVLTALDSRGSATPSAEGGVTTANYKDISVKSVRKIIAERMQASLAQTAQLTLNSSAPAESLLGWRKVYRNSDPASGLTGITINDLVLCAVSRILPQFPELNAHFLGDTIRRFSDVNIGIAVDTPKGLMVPVIPAANKKSLLEISKEVKSLAEKCVSGTASPEELSVGTFTVTNLGAFGIESFTPVLNAPEVAILGVNNIQLKPVLKDDETIFIPHIGLSLTIDHQAVDGAPGARFLKELGKQLSNLEKVAAL